MVIFTIMAKNKKYVKPHRTNSLEDMEWLMTQEVCVRELWWNCAMAEGFGDRFVEFKTHLSERPFARAKKALEGRLFEFQAICELSPAGRAMVVGWKVRNLHGTRNRKYWFED
jgi:hypothetical protein